MDNPQVKQGNKLRNTVIFLLIIALAAGGYFYWQTQVLSAENTKIKEEAKQLNEALTNTTESLANSEKEKAEILAIFDEESKRNSAFAEEVTKRVEDLQKLAELDPELLQKYSKIYFLNENYKPSGLEVIDQKYVAASKTTPIEFHEDALPFLVRMLEEATRYGVNIKVLSGYRSFKTQAELKSSYRVTYGAGTANQFSAEQGYSEHQLGTTLDLTSVSLGGLSTAFEKTPEFAWLQENAYKYGFILSYPKGNKYYIYEPWHWRFIGKELADVLDSENKYFYDLEQREIDQYLGKIFTD